MILQHNIEPETMIRIRKRNSLAIEWCLSCRDSVNIYGDIGKLSQKHADAKELMQLLYDVWKQSTINKSPANWYVESLLVPFCVIIEFFPFIGPSHPTLVFLHFN